jgi:hypothetical protein
MSSTMTDSIDEKPTPRPTRISAQTENFDFELAEVQVNPDNINLDPSPIAHFYDDVSEQAAVKNTDEAQKSEAENSGFVANESILQPAQTVPEIKTSFYVDYFDKRKQRKAAKAEKANAVDGVSQDTVALENTFSTPSEQNNTEQPAIQEQTVDSNAPIVNGAGMAVAVLSQFKSKQESINKQQETLIQDFADRVKKATAITYTAVFFGVSALAAASFLGFMLLKTNSEVSDLTNTTSALQDNIKHNAKAPAAENDLDGTDPSIDELNNTIAQLKQESEASNDDLHNEIEVLQNKIAHLEKTAGIKNANKQPPETSHNPQASMVAAAAVPAEKKPTPETSVKTTSAPTNKPETSVKAIPAPATSKPAKNVIAEPTEPVAVATTGKPQTNSKTANKNAAIIAKKESEIDKAIAVPANDINNLVPQPSNNANTQPTATTAKNTPPASSNNNAQTGNGNWTVNLASSNQLAEAKKSAAAYKQKGIPASIASFTVKNQTRYRLQVKGFKNKEDATAYAKKAKDTLKLESVWINP